jgi:hypothetical protein
MKVESKGPFIASQKLTGFCCQEATGIYYRILKYDTREFFLLALLNNIHIQIRNNNVSKRDTAFTAL